MDLRNFINKARVSFLYRSKCAMMALAMGKKRPRPFIILGHPRSGSTLLHIYLNTHTRIWSLGEHIGERIRAKQPLEQYIESHLLLPRPWPIARVGVKVFCEYAERPDTMSLLKKIAQIPDLQVIILKRNDLLRVWVSRKIAEQTQQWSRTHGTDEVPLSQRQLRADPAECLQALQHLVWLEAQANGIFAHCPSHPIEYEQLASDPKNTLEGLLRFLELPKQRLYTPLIRQNPEPLSHLLVNFEEMKQALEGTPWAI